MNRILQIAWERWQIIAKINGDYLARLLVNLFYFTILVPFALGVKFLADPLTLKEKTAHWLDRKAVGTSLDEAKGQF